TYTVTLTVTDNKGLKASTSQSVTITTALPTASFTVDKNFLNINVNGLGSSDPDGSIVAYAWNFGEPISTNNIVTGATVSHSYALQGRYTVTLTVTDNNGAQATTTQSVIVASAIPTASFTFQQTNLNINVNAATSSVSDGTIASYL